MCTVINNKRTSYLFNYKNSEVSRLVPEYGSNTIAAARPLNWEFYTTSWRQSECAFGPHRTCGGQPRNK